MRALPATTRRPAVTRLANGEDEDDLRGAECERADQQERPEVTDPHPLRDGGRYGEHGRDG